VLRAGGSLPAIARELVDRANAAGGRDNITVVLFRLEAVGDPEAGDDEATRAGAAALRVEDVRRAIDQAPATASEPAAPRPSAAQARRPQPPRGTGIPTPRRRRRLHAGWVISGLLVVMLLAAGYLASQAVYFVGTGDDGFVRVYRGVPLNLPAGLDLYQPVYVSGVSTAQLSPSQTRTITGHRLRARSDADDLVRQLETGRLGSR
jgi:protein phosphatase